ncbi:MAG TPA: hypothetical protein VMH87_14825 [Pseudomonadales bacterium]|nr:hypothetical protein [Pseudomonadales bacterium]
MQRPTSVTVFGILNIVFAGLGLCGTAFSVMLFMPSAATANNPVVQIIQSSPAYAAWMKVSLGLGLVVIVALLAAGIGLLNLKPWARTLSIIYAIYTIIMTLVGVVINYFFLIQPMLQKAQGQQGPEAAGAIGGAIGGFGGGCIAVIYPILLLIFMTRPHVVAAFNQSTPQGGPPPLQ